MKVEARRNCKNYMYLHVFHQKSTVVMDTEAQLLMSELGSIIHNASSLLIKAGPYEL